MMGARPSILRSSQRADELVAPSRAEFKLSAVEAAQILAR
jgi:hypothetical protein